MADQRQCHPSASTNSQSVGERQVEIASCRHQNSRLAAIQTQPWLGHCCEFLLDLQYQIIMTNAQQAALYFPDGGKRIRDVLAESGEPMLPLTEWALKYSRSEPLSISENWDLNVAREAYRREYHALMKEHGVDVILCPAFVGAGALQGQAYYWNYTAIWNILDQPAVVFPTGISVDKEIDRFDSDYKPMNSEDEREWKACKSTSRLLLEGLHLT